MQYMSAATSAADRERALESEAALCEAGWCRVPQVTQRLVNVMAMM